MLQSIHLSYSIMEHLCANQLNFQHLCAMNRKNGVVMEECQLPLIDLDDLNRDNEREKLACCEAICRASSSGDSSK
ncbi:hypothetical protein SLA2020_282610 [Shorea laevis]